MGELWFLVRTAVGGHWACAEEQCVYGWRQKSRGSLEMVENEVEVFYKGS